MIAIVVIVIIAVLFGAGYAVDRLVFTKKSSNFELSQSRSYQQALSDIENYFYRPFSRTKIEAAAQAAVAKDKKNGVTSETTLENDGINALMNALGEPHTQYLTAEENKRLSEDINGSFYGVGIVLRETGKKGDMRPQVFDVIKDSPAAKGGIKKEDIIISVDGKDTKNVNLDLVVSQIRGQNGSTVTLVVQRAGQAKNMTFKLTREKVQIPEIESSMMSGNQGYVRVYNFDTNINTKVRAAVKDLVAKGAKGIILDLRSNPGGLLDEAVSVSSIFINNGVIVSYKEKGKPKVDLPVQGNAETNLPMVTLINGGSASAAEITAGALKDHGRAVLVGSKSYGKGSVQKIYPLSNGGGAKITIALYYLPNGESIDGKGIQPDVKVEVKGDLTAEEKAQLDAAQKVLNNMIQGKPPTAEDLVPAA